MERHPEKREYFIVDSEAMPEVFIKVVEAKRLLESGKAQTAQEASAAVGVSRSAFYKYRAMVFPFYETSLRRNVTFAMNLDNVPGLLGQILNHVAETAANILTINQTIPINNVANVTITIETGESDLGDLFDSIRATPGVLSVKILGRE